MTFGAHKEENRTGETPASMPAIVRRMRWGWVEITAAALVIFAMLGGWLANYTLVGASVSSNTEHRQMADPMLRAMETENALSREVAGLAQKNGEAIKKLGTEQAVIRNEIKHIVKQGDRILDKLDEVIRNGER